jgi:hypothetical protein
MAPTFPRSKPLDFRIWKFKEDVVYIPLMSTALCELQQHIKGAANRRTEIWRGKYGKNRTITATSAG